MKNYHTILVGSGTSAYFVADALLDAGKSLAIIDERPFGGTCALRGCQPKKYLVANAEVVAGAGDLVGKGIAEAPRTDWQQLQALKNEFLDGKPEKSVENWRKRGATTYHERARFVSESALAVGDEVIEADHIVLATGATPRPLDIPGAEHSHVSDDFLELEELPDRIVFIGGGYISFEFAHVARRAGAREVTILHRSEQPLKGFDPDAVDVLVEASREDGIRVITNEEPSSIERQGSELHVHASSGETYPADFVVHATGRVPNLSVLEDGKGDVDAGRHGVEVNEFLQSPSNPRVYAIGDCAATGHLLAPVADLEGAAVAGNLLHGNHKLVDHQLVPSAVFTIPSLAAVGLGEEQARESGHEVRINRGSTTGWPSSKRIGEQHGFYKVIIDRHSDRILGAHLVRHHAGEAINWFALAIRSGLTARELREVPWAYPTLTSDLKYMIE